MACPVGQTVRAGCSRSKRRRSSWWCGSHWRSGVSLRPAIILGILAGVAGNHDETQCPFGSVVGRLHFRLMQESQQIAPVVVEADAVQQSLIVVVAESAVAQVMGDLGVELLN